MNKENLTLLAHNLMCIPQELFDMHAFRRNMEGEATTFKSPTDCGTIGCALGWAPLVEGLGPTTDELRFDDGLCWSAYARRVFGLNPWGHPDGEDFRPMDWSWCFADWADADNTPMGAAIRILWLCEFGLPEDWRGQMIGEAPLCYEEFLNDNSRKSIQGCRKF